MSLQIDSKKSDSISQQSFTTSESAQIIKSVAPKHPALSRLHTELKSMTGTSAITSYDRMHHRHSRS
jgi:hypothetical protein